MPETPPDHACSGLPLDAEGLGRQRPCDAWYRFLTYSSSSLRASTWASCKYTWPCWTITSRHILCRLVLFVAFLMAKGGHMSLVYTPTFTDDPR